MKLMIYKYLHMKITKKKDVVNGVINIYMFYGFVLLES